MTTYTKIDVDGDGPTQPFASASTLRALVEELRS